MQLNNASRKDSLVSKSSVIKPQSPVQADAAKNEENNEAENEERSEKMGENKLIFKKYFQIVDSSGRKNIRAKCNKCGETRKGSLIATTNFKRHLQVNHSFS